MATVACAPSAGLSNLTVRAVRDCASASAAVHVNSAVANAIAPPLRREVAMRAHCPPSNLATQLPSHLRQPPGERRRLAAVDRGALFRALDRLLQAALDGRDWIPGE